MRTLFISLFFASFVLSGISQNDRIEYNGQQLFLNGTNLAWVNFARDIGPDATQFDQFGKLFKEIHDYGANSVRLWLHTNGVSTPEFRADTVYGPGVDAIDDLKRILDSAYKYDVGLILCLWSHDMLRLTNPDSILARNRALLEDENVLNSYIKNALIPMVDSTKDHPGIIAWEVFNEPEGMIAGVPNGGWSSHGHVSRAQIQVAVNRIAGAIHRVKSSLKVTNGTHTLDSNSDKGVHNFYSDSSLFNKGGDADGNLDFYQVHHYDFNLNPFDHPYSYWNLDKPLIIGEFHPDCSTCGDFSNYETIFNNGYAGALGWMWLDSYGDKIKQETQSLFLNHTAEVDIDNNLGDTPYLTFSGPSYGHVFESGSDVFFFTEASDTDGIIEKVEYFLDIETATDSVLTTIIASPYNYVWLNPDDGLYKVYVKVTDDDGYTKQSNPISFIVGDPPVFRYEAEKAVLTGNALISTDATASGGKYVDFKDNCLITWTILNSPADDVYDLIIGYGLPYDPLKHNDFIINGDMNNVLDIEFSGSMDAWHRDTIQIDLLEGENTIEIQDSWGWMAFDFIELPFERPQLITEIILSSSSGLNYIDELGASLQMLATVNPDDAFTKTIEWSVNNEFIATIDSNGILTAKNNGTVSVIATAIDGSEISGLMDITITNQPVSGTNFTDNSDFKIYPNPVKNELYYSNINDILIIKIHNLQGQLIRTFKQDQGSNSIDISDIAKGLYYITIQTNAGEKVNKLFIKE